MKQACGLLSGLNSIFPFTDTREEGLKQKTTRYYHSFYGIQCCMKGFCIIYKDTHCIHCRYSCKRQAAKIPQFESQTKNKSSSTSLCWNIAVTIWLHSENHSCFSQNNTPALELKPCMHTEGFFCWGTVDPLCPGLYPTKTGVVQSLEELTPSPYTYLSDLSQSQDNRKEKKKLKTSCGCVCGGEGQ